MDIKEYRGFSTELVDIIHSLEVKVFDPAYSKEKIQRECSAKHQLIALIALEEGKAIGYKVGYEMTSRLFYSWMGGVLPDYRGKGVARKLMTQQHVLANSLGYTVVRTHTENQYRNMLLLNIRSGFDIVGVVNDINKNKSIIILDKELKNSS